VVYVQCEVLCRLVVIDQSCYNLQPGHYSGLPAPNFQPTATQGMCSFRFTTLITTSNTSNHQSTTLKKHTTHNGTLRLPHTKDHNYWN